MLHERLTERQMMMRQYRDRELELQLDGYRPHPVHKVPTYFFRMISAVTGGELGAINLRIGSSRHIVMYAGHIGYSVHPPHRGKRLAARSLRLLLPLARELGTDPLWITCDPDNDASRRTLELAGAEFVEIVQVPEDCVIRRSGHPEKCRYRLAVAASQDPPHR